MPREIVPVPDPEFDRARQTLAKLKKRCSSAQNSLTRFESADLPQYHGWIEDVFGPRVRELQKLRERCGRLSDLAELTEDLYMLTANSGAECYRRALHCLDDLEAPNPYRDDFWRRVAGEPGDPEEDDGLDEEGDFDPEEVFQGLFRDLAESFGMGGEEAEEKWEAFRDEMEHGAQPGSPTAAKGESEKGESKDLKKTYRNLARQLHPDHREGAGEKENALDGLWHEAHDAYTRGDLEALRRVEAMIETEVRGINESTTIDHLKGAIEAIRHQLRPIERDVRHARKSPAWMFSKKPELRSALKTEVAASLKFSKQHVNRTIKGLKAEIARLKRAKQGKRESWIDGPGQVEIPF